MELALDNSLLLLLGVVAAVTLLISVTSEPPPKRAPARPETPPSRWRVFRIAPKVLHDYESEKTVVVADEINGVRLLAHPFPGQGWEFSLEARSKPGRKGAARRDDALKLEITRRGLLTSRFEVTLDGRPWLSVRVEKGAKVPEIRRHDRGEPLKIAGSPQRRDYEVRRNGKLVAMVSEAPPGEPTESGGDYTLEILRSEDPKQLLTLVLCMEAALPPRQ